MRCNNTIPRLTQPFQHLNKRSTNEPARTNKPAQPAGPNSTQPTCQYDGHGVCIMRHGVDHVLNSLWHTRVAHHSVLEVDQLSPVMIFCWETCKQLHMGLV